MLLRITSPSVWFFLLLAILLRMTSLTSQSLWFDEAFSWCLVTEFPLHEVVARTAADVHPPLYYLLLRTWIGCCGDSVVALRGLSVAFAIASLIAVDVFCRNCFEPGAEGDVPRKPGSIGSAGSFAVAILASNAFHIHWSQQTRMYTLGAFLAVVTATLLIRALKHPLRLSGWVWYSLFAVCFLYTHNYAVFFIASNAVFALVLSIVRVRKPFAQGSRRQIINFALAHGLIGLLYAPWIAVVASQSARVEQNYWIGSLHWWTIPECFYQLFFPSSDESVGVTVGSVTFFFSLIAVLLRFAVRADWRRWLVLVQVVCPVAIASVVSLTYTPIVVTRYFLFSLMFVAITIGAVCGNVLPLRIHRVVLAGIAGCGIIFHVNFVVNELRTSERPGVMGAMKYVEAEFSPSDGILVRHSCIFFSVKYYARGLCEPKLHLPAGEALHFTGGPLLRSCDVASTSMAEHWSKDRLWVIDTSGFNLPGARFAIPECWQPLDGTRRTFPDVYSFQRDVSCTQYVKTGSALLLSRPLHP